MARALLRRPKVLLMDEPASGLDPRARIEIRELLKELRRMGKTIIISSHILHELAELCNSVGIIEQGKLLFSGEVSEAMAQAQLGFMVIVGVEQRTEDAAELLRTVEGVDQVELSTTSEEPRIEVMINPDSGLPISDLAGRLVAQGYRINELRREQVNLETAFMRLTRGVVS